MIFISTEVGSPPMPCAHSLPFSVLWLREGLVMHNKGDTA